jgi:antibiotic biosynthesis monooxygenase (ABM) superfamily enzyme
MPESSLQIHGEKASSVIVQRVPSEIFEQFSTWQHGIVDEASRFPGYINAELFPARDPHDEWVAIVHFNSFATLRNWNDSPERAAWLAKRPPQAKDYRLTVLPSGFGQWFAGLASGKVPTWKAVLSILLGLYPTSLLVRLFLVPQLQSMPVAFAILVISAVNVVFLQCVGMPMISRTLRPWLRASDRRISFLGAAGIVLGLFVLAFVFQMIG